MAVWLFIIFQDSVILTLYNFGANPREEYMLLKLFQVTHFLNQLIRQLNVLYEFSILSFL